MSRQCSGRRRTRLPASRSTLPLMVDVYHELAQPQVFLRALKAGAEAEGGWR